MKKEEATIELLEKKMSEEMSDSLDDEILTSCWYNGHDIDSVEFRIKEMRQMLSQEMSKSYPKSYPGLNKMEYVESVDDAIKMGLTGKDLENAKRYFNIRDLYNRVNDIYMALPKASDDDYKNKVNAYIDLEKILMEETFKIK